MRKVKTGATSGEMVGALNRLIDEFNEGQDALEASIRAEYGLDDECCVEDCCIDQGEPCPDCGEGPCEATPACIVDNVGYAVLSALDALRYLCDNGSEYDKLAAAKVILAWQISAAGIEHTD